MNFIKTEEFEYILIPLLIFLLRMLDVSMGTLRIIFVAKGYKKLAPLIGFFEILIWIYAVSTIMQNMNNWVYYIAYAGGFSAGNYLGIILEEKLAIGHELIRVITKKEAYELVFSLKEKGFGITSINAEGKNGPVSVIYIVIKRKYLGEVISIIKTYNPQAFYTIEDIRTVSKNVLNSQLIIKRK